MAIQWTSIRLARETHTRLLEWAERLWSAVQDGRAEQTYPEGGPSLDWVVAELLRRAEAHRERSARSNERVRARRAKGRTE